MSENQLTSSQIQQIEELKEKRWQEVEPYLKKEEERDVDSTLDETTSIKVVQIQRHYTKLIRQVINEKNKRII